MRHAVHTSLWLVDRSGLANPKEDRHLILSAFNGFSTSLKQTIELTYKVRIPAVKSSTGLVKRPSWPVKPTDPKIRRAVSLR